MRHAVDVYMANSRAIELLKEAAVESGLSLSKWAQFALIKAATEALGDRVPNKYIWFMKEEQPPVDTQGEPNNEYSRTTKGI